MQLWPGTDVPRSEKVASLEKALRVCPGSCRFLTELSEHEADRGKAQEREGLSVEALPILGQASATIKPGDGALDDPSLGQDSEALCCIGALDDFHIGLSKDFANGGLKDRPLIAAVGIELQQEWIQAKQRGHHQHPAVSILDVCRMYKSVEQQALSID
jgi:hypothetical protein